MPKNGTNTTQAGYGYTFQRLRKAWAARVARGEVTCWRCGRLIQSTLILDPDGRYRSSWDLGHHDEDRSVVVGPEHRRCNRSAAAYRLQGRRLMARPMMQRW